MEARENNHPITMRSLVDPRRISIEPFRGWQILDPLEFWRFRELLLFLAWRDIRVRYRQTLIGAAWAVVQPACMVVVFSLFLGKLAHVSSTDVPYPLFAFCGLLPWIFFSTAVNSSANSVLNSEKLVTKVYFPRIIIPLAATGSAILDLLITTSMLGVAPYGLRPTIWHPHFYWLQSFSFASDSRPLGSVPHLRHSMLPTATLSSFCRS